MIALVSRIRYGFAQVYRLRYGFAIFGGRAAVSPSLFRSLPDGTPRTIPNGEVRTLL